MVIEKLSNDIINQIAAGEVIENPSAVIKELIENSIDANANKIEIEIENYGLDKIIVKDNGYGILKSDLLKALLRHATSKIKSFNDLYNINTMGFRGEALASIFSIAKTKIISKVDGEKAFEISSENLNKVHESGAPNGTQIFIENLFYNTPARKKYLKSNNLELRSILEIVNRYEIFYKNIKFSLRHNGKLLINKPIFKTDLDNLYYVLGKDLKDNLFKLNFEKQGIKISGFIGKPSSLTYSFRKNQYIYVNSRFVKSKLIRDSIYEGFSTNLMSGRHPFFILFIEIDPQIIDVNVHPTKIEIKFENELEIYEFVKKSIQNIFEKKESFKNFETSQNFEFSESLGISNSLIKEKDLNLFEKFSEKELPAACRQPAVKKYSQKNTTNYTKDTQQELLKEQESTYKTTDLPPTSNLKPQTSNLLSKTLKEYRILGQINKTFIVIETPKEMILLDQHVVEEKFYFEIFKEQIENKKNKTQKLLKQVLIKLSNIEMLTYRENLNLIEKLGFKTEEFGSNEIIVREIPIGFNNQEINAQIIKDILGEITIDKKFKLLEDKKIEKIASMSCKKSIKGGDELTKIQIQNMIENLKKLKEPFNCPHGRPIMLRYTFIDLEKKFKR